ncbi:MAG: hypothetical protein KGQ41_09205 [Alphaproteobacteria bacterium]|nr:hypothetical protein [Alphaproteobacteria bacterium]
MSATALKTVYEPAAKQEPISVGMTMDELRKVFGPRDSRFMIAFPKSGGRTLSLTKQVDGKTIKMEDDEIFGLMGFTKGRRITDAIYELVDTTGVLSDSPVKIYVNERKPKDIARLLSTSDDNGVPMANLGVMGNDVRDEITNLMGTTEGRQQGLRLSLETRVELDVSRGGIALIVPEGMDFKNLRQMKGCDIVTKYPKLAEAFRKTIERKYGIVVGQVRPRDGGTEDDFLLDDSLKFVLDFVQSGGSSARRGLQVAFMNAAEWGEIKDGKKRFDKIPPAEMVEMDSVLQTSEGLLVRSYVRYTPEQQRICNEIERRMTEALVDLGYNPIQAAEIDDEKRPEPKERVRDVADTYSYGPHSAWSRGPR